MLRSATTIFLGVRSSGNADGDTTGCLIHLLPIDRLIDIFGIDPDDIGHEGEEIGWRVQRGNDGGIVQMLEVIAAIGGMGQADAFIAERIAFTHTVFVGQLGEWFITKFLHGGIGDQLLDGFPLDA